jgi:hypothetical protein
MPRSPFLTLRHKLVVPFVKPATSVALAFAGRWLGVVDENLGTAHGFEGIAILVALEKLLEAVSMDAVISLSRSLLVVFSAMMLSFLGSYTQKVRSHTGFGVNLCGSAFVTHFGIIRSLRAAYNPLILRVRWRHSAARRCKARGRKRSFWVRYN